MLGFSELAHIRQGCAEMLHLGDGEHPHCSWIAHSLPWIQPFNFIHIAQILVFSHLNNCSIFFGPYNHIPFSDPERILKDDFPRSHCDLPPFDF